MRLLPKSHFLWILEHCILARILCKFTVSSRKVCCSSTISLLIMGSKKKFFFKYIGLRIPYYIIGMKSISKIAIILKNERNITKVIYSQKRTFEKKKAPRPRRHCYYADDCCTQSPKKSLENQQSNLHKQKKPPHTFLTLSKCIFSQYCSYKHFSKYKYKLTPPNF